MSERERERESESYTYISPGAGADVNRRTGNNDHTVLSLACSGGHISTVQYLLGRGANPTHILRVSLNTLSLLSSPCVGIF